MMDPVSDDFVKLACSSGHITALSLPPPVSPAEVSAVSPGGLLHGSVPLRGPDRPPGPRSHAAWRLRRDCLLPEPRLVQTGRSSGDPHTTR